MQTSLAARRAGIVFNIAFAIVAPAVAGAQTTVRPRLDLTPMTNVTRTIPAALVTPAMAQNIGPGSHLIIDIPGAGTFGCTANFIWAGGAARYLGAAGHCFLPEGATATHGSGADFDSSGVVVRVCVSNCSFGGETGFTLTGDLVQLGAVAYARQTAASGDIGNDFGVVTIPAALAAQVRPSEPVFGGPTSVDTITTASRFAITATASRRRNVRDGARVGVGGGSTAASWSGALAAAPGDSGSAVLTCDVNATGVSGRGAAGVLTHLGVGTQGFVFGTTVARAIQMAAEAGLALSVVLP